MLGSKKQDFGLFKTRLTDDSTTYTIVGVKHETEEVYTDANRTVYREER